MLRMGAAMIENRRNIRSRTLYKGVIAFNRRRSTMNCVIRNLSTEGAKLAVSSAVTVPESFELAITHKQRSYEARVIWRGRDEVGVEFIDQQGSIAAPLDLTRELHALKLDNAALRRRVAQLSQS